MELYGVTFNENSISEVLDIVSKHKACVKEDVFKKYFPKLYIDLMSIRPDVKVIVISGFSAKEAVDKMLAYGAKAFLPKPFSIEELDSKIQEVL